MQINDIYVLAFIGWEVQCHPYNNKYCIRTCSDEIRKYEVHKFMVVWDVRCNLMCNQQRAAEPTVTTVN